MNTENINREVSSFSNALYAWRMKIAKRKYYYRFELIVRHTQEIAELRHALEVNGV